MEKLSDKAREYAQLVADKRRMEAGLEDLNKILAKMETDLLAEMGDQNVTSLRVKTEDGSSFTLFPRRELWASCIPGHEQELNDGLKLIGYGDMVRETVNSQRLSAYVRELDAAELPLPTHIAGAVKVTEKFRVGVRRA